MILRSFLFIIFIPFKSFILINFLFADEPMSAIDWLAKKINDPPVFYTYPSEIDENSNIEIEKMVLPNISKNSIGIYPSIKIGINSDIWKNNNEIEISTILKKIRISDLYYLNRLLKRILLIESDPPIIAVDEKFSGTIFLRQRILKLIQMGALDDAEALILDSEPTFDPNLTDLWSEISFLTYRFERFCKAILNGYHNSLEPAHKIICLARSGDWNAAALSLATFSSINEIDSDHEKLLINYLDHEAELEIINKDKCEEDKSVIIYLCNFSNINTQIPSYGVKFLYNNLGRGKSIRSRIVASEELVKSGALNPNILFSTYKIKQPSTSGGVWARAKLVQELDRIIQYDFNNYQYLSNHLNIMIDEFLKNKLLTAFAISYGKKLKSSISNFQPLNDLILITNILTGEYSDLLERDIIIDLKLKNLISVLNKRDKSLLGIHLQERLKTFRNKDYTELQNAILKASNGIYPENVTFMHETKNDYSNQDGLVLLNAILKISNSLNYDITDMQTGLASLVRLGLLNDFKAISNELLIMEYFKKI